MFVEQSTQEFGVLLVLSAADLADTEEGAESAGVPLSSKHHHLVGVDMHSNVLVQARQTHKTDVSPHWVDQPWLASVLEDLGLIKSKCDIVVSAL